MSYVFDSDTFEVKEPAGRVRVRGVNAPEITHDGEPAQCYGPEATTRARAAVLGKPVTLDSDPTQPATDRYGRQLRYVDVAGTDLGQMLLDGGFAREYHLSSEGPTQRTASYLATQNTARSRQAGPVGCVTQLHDQPVALTLPNIVPCTAGAPRRVRPVVSDLVEPGSGSSSSSKPSTR